MRIHVERHPGADPVLLVHGFATTGALTWESTGWVAALAEAGRGAIVPDLRGHGASDAPHDPAAYSPDLLAEDLLAVLDEQGLDRADVIGYSMGSWVALALVGLAPERVRRLVVGGVGTVEQFAHWGVEAVQRAILDGAETLPADAPLAPLLASLREAPESTGRRSPRAPPGWRSIRSRWPRPCRPSWWRATPTRSPWTRTRPPACSAPSWCCCRAATTSRPSVPAPSSRLLFPSWELRSACRRRARRVVRCARSEGVPA
ncbi:alpha/beta fold hydrolase [Leifsonia sp. P73]|uniref:alpha/beta fold hydrolase n=1 Tax=Leifsonia sp. P73 TaxID=3423959 RepID=UPI003DA52A02